MTAAAVSTPFEGLAPTYDRDFTASAVGTCLRAAVWRHLDAGFPPGASVLDLGCGTGEDAVHLALRGVTIHAIDAAPSMVEAAREKAARAGVAGLVTVERRSIEELPALAAGTSFDGAYSNFGPLNCVEDLPSVGRALATLLRPGAPLLVCLLGRCVPWEWAWFLARGQTRRAFRRFSRRGTPWHEGRRSSARRPTPGTGGTILGSSRGHQDISEMVDTLDRMNIGILFAIGGDGTLRGAQGIAEEVQRRGLKISVIGIPKTIDNDISYVERSFGFETAVSEAVEAIDAAHTEGQGRPQRDRAGQAHGPGIRIHRRLRLAGAQRCEFLPDPRVPVYFGKAARIRARPGERPGARGDRGGRGCRPGPDVDQRRTRRFGEPEVRRPGCDCGGRAAPRR